MKIGLRKPSIKRSIKASTTGRLKREIKKSIIPWYGKKGIGILHPKKAIYNKIYKKTSFSFWDLLSNFIDEFESEEETKNQIHENNVALPKLENNFKVSIESNLNSTDNFDYFKDLSNPKFHRTPDEKQCKFEFFDKFCNQNSKLDDLEQNLIELHKMGNTAKERNKKIELYNEAINCYDEIKSFCYSRGSGGILYFDDMWEHCHNASNSDFSYGQTIIDKRDSLINERDVYIPLIITIVSENNGMLQKNIYSLLPEINKSTVQKLIRELEFESKIKRTKKNSSYILEIL